MLTARHAVVVCTGSTAALPDLPGIAEAHAWTNRAATDSSDVPPRLAIVGDGGVAVEMATAWQGLGSSVTLLSRLHAVNLIGARGRRPVDTSLWGAHVATADVEAVPQVFFCDPEAASVGLTTGQAQRAGHRVRAVDVDLERVPGALLFADGYRGRARIVVNLDHGYLSGATFVGPGMAELLHSATVAVAGRVPIDRLWHVVPCFPTISEVWLRLLEAYRG